MEIRDKKYEQQNLYMNYLINNKKLPKIQKNIIKFQKNRFKNKMIKSNKNHYKFLKK